jgi:hypothetical protein
MVTEEARAELGGEVSGRQIEQLVDELILFANISVADPPRLAVAPQNLIRARSLRPDMTVAKKTVPEAKKTRT